MDTLQVLTSCRNSLVWGILGLIMCGAAGCSPTALDRPADPNRLVDWNVALPAWSADGQTIFYTGVASSYDNLFSVWSVDVGTRVSRELGKAPGWALGQGGRQVRSAGASPTVFFSFVSAVDRERFNMFRVSSSGGTPELLSDNGGQAWFSVSSSGNRLAYTGRGRESDTLLVLTFSSAGAVSASSYGTGIRGPLYIESLSPDGSKIIFRGGDALNEYDVNTSTQRKIWRAAEVGADSLWMVSSQVAWAGATPHLLVATRGRSSGLAPIFISDFDTQTNTRVFIDSITGTLSLPMEFTWTQDRKSFAAWVPVAVVGANLERTIYRAKLWVSTPQTGGPKALRELTTDESPNWMEFSPDSRYLAWVLIELYAVPVP